MAFTWTTVALLLLSALGFLSSYLAHRRGRDRSSGTSVSSFRRRGSTERQPRFTGGFGLRHNRDTSEESYTKAQESGIKPDDRASYDTADSQQQFLNRDTRLADSGRGYDGGGYIGAEGASGRM